MLFYWHRSPRWFMCSSSSMFKPSFVLTAGRLILRAQKRPCSFKLRRRVLCRTRSFTPLPVPHEWSSIGNTGVLIDDSHWDKTSKSRGGKMSSLPLILHDSSQCFQPGLHNNIQQTKSCSNVLGNGRFHTNDRLHSMTHAWVVTISIIDRTRYLYPILHNPTHV